MDEKTKALCDELLVIIVLFYTKIEQGIRFEHLYSVFNYGFGTISDLLKILVSEEHVRISFDQEKPPIGYPEECLPIPEQVQKLHLCSDWNTYIFPTPEGRVQVVEILTELKDQNREFKFTAKIK